MKKIVFFCIPAHGHTNPTLGVVRELISRGHQVWYYSYNAMREKIESTGAIFVSCDDYDMGQKLSPKSAVRVGKDLAFSIRVLTDTTLALDDTVCAHMEQLKPDCIVADSMAIWGKAVALKLGIPFVSSTTTFAFNRYSAKNMKQSAGELFRMILSLPKISKQIKRLQNKGYPIKSFLDILQNDNDTHTVVYTSPQFQPYSHTFSDKYAFVGPSIRPAGDRIEKKKDKLIYISMGTVNNDMMPLYRKCLSALADTEYQVIMSVGDLVCVDAFGPLPENISIFPHVDQISVLQQADVFLSHCGMNSVTESLYFGVPLVMLPQTAEQCAVAARVYELGAGIKLDKSDASSILNAIQTILSDDAYRQNAAEISAGFKTCSGARGAADKIMQVCEHTI
ncbi:MAG: glucosyltransferase [Oscillospiraceae bacterium]|nr:glucosyltransferase [Oscillospiraceae bacterium]